METIQIIWKGPYLLTKAHLPEIANENGLYVVSRKWGQTETLLYLGRTKRTFAQRIQEHKWWLTELRGQVFIRFGLIELAINQRFSEKRLADIESLLISYHRPPENTMNNTYYYGREKLEVINIGRRGPLAARVSTDDLEWVK